MTTQCIYHLQDSTQKKKRFSSAIWEITPYAFFPGVKWEDWLRFHACALWYFIWQLRCDKKTPGSCAAIAPGCCLPNNYAMSQIDVLASRFVQGQLFQSFAKLSYLSTTSLRGEIDSDLLIILPKRGNESFPKCWTTVFRTVCCEDISEVNGQWWGQKERKCLEACCVLCYNIYWCLAKEK